MAGGDAAQFAHQSLDAAKDVLVARRLEHPRGLRDPGETEGRTGDPQRHADLPRLVEGRAVAGLETLSERAQLPHTAAHHLAVPELKRCSVNGHVAPEV